MGQLNSLNISFKKFHDDTMGFNKGLILTLMRRDQDSMMYHSLAYIYFWWSMQDSANQQDILTIYETTENISEYRKSFKLVNTA